MMTPEQAARLRARLERLDSTVSHERADARYYLTHPDMAEANARLLLRYHNALSLDRLAAALTELLAGDREIYIAGPYPDGTLAVVGELDVRAVATALRTKLMETDNAS